MRKLFYIVCLFVVSSFAIRAQDAIATTEQLIADIFEQYTAESEDEIDYDTFYEQLMYCAENPINLNQTTKEELEHLIFLSDIQIENIMAYVYQNSRLETIYELQLIQGLDMTDIRRLLPFIKIEDVEQKNEKIYWSDIKLKSKNELFVRLDKGLETKEGYRFNPEEEIEEGSQSKYIGNAIYNSLKYRFHYKDRILIGFTAEKDAGEKLIGQNSTGYDFISFTAQLNNFGKFKTIVLGDFKASFGQGLVVNTEMGMGKSSYVLNVTNRNNGLKKYSSTDETNFFRGAGITLKVGPTDVSFFYSNKFRDADTSTNTLSSFYTTGLHRTPTEISKKKTVNQQVAGINIRYLFSKIELGFTAVHTKLDAKLIPEKTVYNKFYIEGNNQNTAGINYRGRWQKLNLFGETGISTNNAVASINGFSFSPISQISLVALHRIYSPKYDTFFATAFAETSRVSNENGTYIGVEIRPVKKWKIVTYIDSYQFKWPKYGIDAPSIGSDYLLQADYSPLRNVTMFWRFKYEKKEHNFTETTAVMPVIIPSEITSLKYNLNYNVGNFYFKNIVECNLSREGNFPFTYGITAVQDISYVFQRLPLKIDFRYQFFDAVDYQNRFYTYEKDLLYAFSIPMFYGLGSRFYLNFKYEISEKIAVWFKLAQTIYADDRETLSSSSETILGNRKTDVRFLLKWSF